MKNPAPMDSTSLIYPRHMLVGFRVGKDKDNGDIKLWKGLRLMDRSIVLRSSWLRSLKPEIDSIWNDESDAPRLPYH